MLDAHPIRDLVAQRSFGVAELGVGAERVAAHDSIAGTEIGYACADGGDDSGGFAARNERRLGLELIFTREHQHVDVLHAARADLHLDLAWTGWRRVRHIPQ